MKIFRQFFRVSLPVLFWVSFSSANAQNICEPYLGQTVQPLQATALWKQLASLPTVKGEYETTPAFEKRVADAISSITGPAIVEIPIQRSYITYDADSRRLDIQSYAFANGTTRYSGVFGYGTPFYEKIKYGVSDNIDIVLPSEETHDGNYMGTNAMGVKVRVTKVKRFTKVIFEREGQSGESLFPNLIEHDSPVLSFNDVTPDIAKKVKETSRAAIVYMPKTPYFAAGKFPWGDPTIENPKDIDETIEVAIGDIQCALFLNSSGVVYGAIPTR